MDNEVKLLGLAQLLNLRTSTTDKISEKDGTYIVTFEGACEVWVDWSFQVTGTTQHYTVGTSSCVNAETIVEVGEAYGRAALFVKELRKLGLRTRNGK